jgi:hypothetical protein
MDTIISHDGQPAPAETPAPTAASSFDSLEAFIAAGHDPDVLNWTPAEFTEYGQFAAEFLAQAAQHRVGGGR